MSCTVVVVDRMPRTSRMNSGIPVRMCFEKNHQCGRRSSASALAVVDEVLRVRHARAAYSRRRSGRGAASLTGPSTRSRYALANRRVGIEPCAHPREPVPLGVAGRERRASSGSAASPSAAGRRGRSMIASTPSEVPLERHAASHVHGDVARLAAVGGAQRDVVRRGEPHLDREVDAQVRRPR